MKWGITRMCLCHGTTGVLSKELPTIPGGRANHSFIGEGEGAQRMNYRSIARRAWPIGSGAVESACRQKQCRCKRPGKFWTQAGIRHLAALDQARRNHHWEQLWSPN